MIYQKDTRDKVMAYQYLSKATRLTNYSVIPNDLFIWGFQFLFLEERCFLLLVLADRNVSRRNVRKQTNE